MPAGFSSGASASSRPRSNTSVTTTQRNISPATTRGTYTPGSSVGSQGGSGYRPQVFPTVAPSVISTYRSGDYIYTQFSNGTTQRTYSPLANQSRPVTQGFGSSSVSTLKAQQQSGATGGFAGGSQVARPSGGYSGNTGGGGNIGAGSGTGGSGSVGGGQPGGSVTGGLNDSDVGQLFGWTKDMTETDVMRGLEYPMRILQQVMGRDMSNNPAFGNFMNPLVQAIANPNTQLLFNPQLGGSNTTTGSEGYNFIADMLKGYMTPGGALPDVGSALSRIASALGNNQSGIYNLLMQGANGSGAAQGQSGMGAYGAMFDALSGMIDPILSLGMSPLQSMITNASMNNLMNNFMMNVNDQSENPLAYVLRGLGYNTNIAGMPAIGNGTTGPNGSNPNDRF